MSKSPQPDEAVAGSTNQDEQPSRAPLMQVSKNYSITIGNRVLPIETVLKVGGLCWFGSIGLLFDGRGGVTLALVVAIITVSSQPLVAVGMAHAGFLLLYPDLTALTPLRAGALLLYELGLAALLLSEPPIKSPTVVVTGLLTLLFTITLFAVIPMYGTVAAAMILIFIAFLLGYLIHRYERVSLGLVATDVETAESSS